jgi:muramidase (phage lysozyme)
VKQTTAFVLVVALAAGCAWLLIAQPPAIASADPLADPTSYDTTDEPSQLPGMAEAMWNEATDMNFSTTPADQAQANTRAFLDTLAFSEGTAAIGDRGYNALFGGGTFDSYADHPRQRFQFHTTDGRIEWTSAAGRYQFIVATWDALRLKLGLPDFSPASQDAACLELIRQRGALADVQAGNFTSAIAKCAPTWASLPGAGYLQPERKLSQLQAAYTQAGGTLNA